MVYRSIPLSYAALIHQSNLLDFFPLFTFFFLFHLRVFIEMLPFVLSLMIFIWRWKWHVLQSVCGNVTSSKVVDLVHEIVVSVLGYTNSDERVTVDIIIIFAFNFLFDTFFLASSSSSSDLNYHLKTCHSLKDNLFALNALNALNYVSYFASKSNLIN